MADSKLADTQEAAIQYKGVDCKKMKSADEGYIFSNRGGNGQCMRCKLCNKARARLSRFESWEEDRRDGTAYVPTMDVWKLSLTLSLSLYTYIYIYVYKYRERHAQMKCAVANFD